jgi:hypothetical protein
MGSHAAETLYGIECSTTLLYGKENSIGFVTLESRTRSLTPKILYIRKIVCITFYLRQRVLTGFARRVANEESCTKNHLL